ncbi:GGDEF domain-containing protein [Candidatus Poriferisodalis sp.]|uniref:GGDEF domain-containing protein n=1 Tax=Candidatus Poriferisodalis sp. TaxID=3101277 RepID=UPI003B015033
MRATVALWHPVARHGAGDSTPGAFDSVLDPVTGLPDVRVFAVLLDRKLAMARRSLQPLSVVFFEVDAFDKLSATQARVAQRLATRLVCGTLRESDSVCHCADGILAAILDDTSHSGAVWAAGRVRREAAARTYHMGLTLSMGVASYPTHALEAADLRDRAYAALFAARSLGPARLEVAETLPR